MNEIEQVTHENATNVELADRIVNRCFISIGLFAILASLFVLFGCGGSGDGQKGDKVIDQPKAEESCHD